MKEKLVQCAYTGVAALGFVCVVMFFVLLDALFGLTPREFSLAKDGPRG